MPFRELRWARRLAARRNATEGVPYSHSVHHANTLERAMRVSEAYGPGKLGLSFELFPPKTEAGEANLFGHLDELMAFRPSFVTCTYGAGGSTRHKTLDIVVETRRRYGCTVASHLTCVGSTVAELRAYLSEARDRGVENIVALRGDPPQGDSARFVRPPAACNMPTNWWP